MINKDDIKAVINEWLPETDCFLVDVRVSPDNNIIIEIDNTEGVDIDRCISLHRLIESQFDRETEDYELEVGSAGVTSPFKVTEQYIKNIGNEVEVLTRAGIKLAGVLKEADEKGFTIGILKKVKAEGSKRKVEVEEILTFSYEDIKYTKYLIRFK